MKIYIEPKNNIKYKQFYNLWEEKLTNIIESRNYIIV